MPEPKDDAGTRRPGDPPPGEVPDASKADTSTDWDEWMEKHGGRPPSRPDVADEEGRLPNR